MLFLQAGKLNPEFSADSESAEDQPKLNDMRVFAGRLLARREYGVRELEVRLLRKFAGFDQIEQRISLFIESLQAEDALSDERFTEMFIRSRRNRNQGPVKIRADLRKRRVPEAIIEANLQQWEDEWGTSASAWLSRQVSGPLDFHARAKYYRRLMNRGFSHQQAMDAVVSHK